jgi:legumain
VVIAAGSNGYQNYRHQADACHAYTVAIANGIPADHIVLMMFDDIANNEGNPFPGKLFNTIDGQDVYAACNLDYTGKQVHGGDFFAILESHTLPLPRRSPW